MCLGNRAEGSANFINGQLHSLHSNAENCVKKHPGTSRPTSSAVEFGTSLAQFYSPDLYEARGKREATFFSKFKAPVIDFVCNHEVVLTLTLDSGYYYLKVNESETAITTREDIENFKFALRVPFTTPGVHDVERKAIGVGKFDIELLVLDFNAAEFCPEHSKIPGIVTKVDEYTKDAKLESLKAYILEDYLPLLTKAGYHVLYSLPDFDLLKETTSEIDYSVISKTTLSHSSIFDVKVLDINAYLRTQWLLQAAYVGEFGFKVGGDTDIKGYLAEQSSVWEHSEEDVFFHAKFGPISVKPLCKTEVIVWFNIEKIGFYKDGGFKQGPVRNSHNWKVACLFDAVGEYTDNVLMGIKLQVDSMRFCEHLSDFGTSAGDDLRKLREGVKRYLKTYYIGLMAREGHHFIYRRSPHSMPKKKHYWCDCDTVENCGHASPDADHVRFGVLQKKVITDSDMYGFKHITAVSQGSINYYLANKWQKSLDVKNGTEAEMCLSHYNVTVEQYGKEVFFSALFAPPELQFDCGGGKGAILYVTLSDGYLKHLSDRRELAPNSRKIVFHDWRIAFRVELDLRVGGKNTKDLVIDFSKATVSLKNSSAPSLLKEEDSNTLRQTYEALIHYLKHFYFGALTRSKNHILYKVHLSDAEFHLYPFTYGPHNVHQDTLHGIDHVISDRNMIVFFSGSSGSRLPRSVNWVCGYSGERPFGTVSIESGILLDSWKTGFLNDISRNTVLVPSFSGVVGETWQLDLQLWKDHKHTRGQPCIWEEAESTANTLALKFYNQDEWTYTHRDSKTKAAPKGRYTVTCTSQNDISIPTDVDADSFRITLTGSVNVELHYEGEGQSWKGHMEASWSTAIVFGSDVKVSVETQDIKPRFKRPVCDFNEKDYKKMGYKTLEFVYEDFLKEEKYPTYALKGFIEDFNKVLKTSIDRVTYGNSDGKSFSIGRPVFNRKGDFIFQLFVPGYPDKDFRRGSLAVQPKWSQKTYSEAHQAGKLNRFMPYPIAEDIAVPVTKKVNGSVAAPEKVANGTVA